MGVGHGSAKHSRGQIMGAGGGGKARLTMLQEL